MSIIKPEKTRELIKVKFNFDTEIYEEIEKYCKWATIEDLGIFFKQAAMYVLQKDKDWKLYKNGKK